MVDFGALHILTIRLTDHLTRERLQQVLAALELPSEGRLALVVDSLLMTGYDLDARLAFVEWNRAHKERLAGVAILTRKVAWRMVVAGMALAVGQPMRCFESEDDVGPWLATLANAPTRPL